MAPNPNASAVSPAAVVSSSDPQQWVQVTWMPHTTLSQTSLVTLSVRSAHAVINEDIPSPTNSSNDQQDETEFRYSMPHQTDPEWKVRATVHGMAGLLLVPVPMQTPTEQLRKRSATPLEGQSQGLGSSIKARRRPTVFRATHDVVWDVCLQLPIRWRDLPRDAYLLLEILASPVDTVVYRTTLPFFSRYGKLATGLQKLRLQKAPLDSDRNYGLYPLAKPHPSVMDGNDNNDDEDPVWKASCILHELERFDEERATAKTRIPPPVPATTAQASSSTSSSTAAAAPHHASSSTGSGVVFGEVPRVPWLDELVKERSRQILDDHAASAATTNQLLLWDENDSSASLIVELPVFDIPIMHEETFYPIPQHGASGAVSPLDLSLYRKRQLAKEGSTSTAVERKDSKEPFDPLQLVPFLDYENETDNPFEDKYRTLAHDLLRGLVDPALKPDREQRDRLAAIIDSPSHHLSLEEKDLLWRFRFSLVDNRRALTKFLLAVDWTVESEVVQAAELLEQWRKRSPIEVTDALKLLGKHVAFQTNLVRTYAIDTLAAAPDNELRLYLLQLVQALKYETMEMIPDSPSVRGTGGTNASTSSVATTQVSSLATFLINRAAGNVQLANYLYWYLKVELQDPTHGAHYREVFSALKARLSVTPFDSPDGHDHPDDISASIKSMVDSVSKLGTKLRGTDAPVDTDKNSGAKKSGRRRTIWNVLVAQENFISGVMDIQLRCRDSRGKKDAKETQLRSLLSKEGYDRKSQRDPVPLPSAPVLLVNGVNPETAKVFKSALYPGLIEFHVEGMLKTSSDIRQKKSISQHRRHSSSKAEAPVSSYKVIVKTGDDLRQDQLIIMMIQLMDGLLKRAALDLCLTPYSIIATSPTSGLVEFVDGSMPISAVLSSYNGSIMQFFQAVAPEKGAKYDVRPDVLSTYVRSCAGYCVITYLLGVGDRHLDNILLRTSGHFFHIDFGFIFGRDPKPLPPAFRLTREMVDGFGGLDSTEYRHFCSLACQAFNALRKSAGLVLNLLSLMSDAGIEDLSNNPSMDADGVLAKVEERFRLDLTDEQAERFFVGLINDCLAAIAPRVMDVFHSFSVARR